MSFFHEPLAASPVMNRSLIVKADEFDTLPTKFLAERMRVGDVIWYSQQHDAFVFTPKAALLPRYGEHDVMRAALDYVTNPLPTLIKENDDG